MLPTFPTILAPEVPTSWAKHDVVILDDQDAFAIECHHRTTLFSEETKRVIVGMSNGPTYILAAATSKARHGIQVNGYLSRRISSRKLGPGLRFCDAF
jgi:hypothetical protein